LTFVSKEELKLAKLVEYRDLSKDDFKLLLDPTRQESFSLPSFQESIRQIRSDNFEMSEAETQSLFTEITQAVRTTGVSLSMTRLTEKVYHAFGALQLEQLRDGLIKSMKSLSELFNARDANRDGILTTSEFEQFLFDIRLPQKPNALAHMLTYFDPKGMGKVTFEVLKFYLSDRLVGSYEIKSVDVFPSHEKEQSEYS